MLKDRNAPALSGKWGGRWADRDNGLIAEVEARIQSSHSGIESRVDAAQLSQRARAEELRWLNAPEFQIRAEMEKRLEAYFKRKREKAA